MEQDSDADSNSVCSQQDQGSVGSLEPQPCDVLFGRGKPFQTHPGNIYFLSLIDTQRGAYDIAGRGMKKEITSRIILLVKESSGRFLKKETNVGWIEVEDHVARLKASTAFRTWRSAILSKAGKSIQNQDSNRRLMAP
jgi:hypothetical protein